MKTALLVASFGTTHPDSLRKAIAATEETIASAFPDYPLYRAFTSRIVRSRLKKELNIAVDSVEEALKRIAADGFTHVLLQPTMLIPGEAFHRLNASVHTAKGNLQVTVGQPLLWDDADMDNVLSALEQTYPTDEETVLLMMGHGTQQGDNGIYERLAQKMCQRTGSLMRLCTMEGSPSFADAIQELSNGPCKKALVAPLLFAAGGHVMNDMAGEKTDSLRSMLKAKGFDVACAIQGLGEIPAVQQLYVNKARSAQRTLY